MQMRLPFVVIAVLLALLIPVGFASDSGSESVAAPAPPSAPIPVIAERVERLRGLEFETSPEPERVSPEQTRTEGLAELDRTYTPEERAAEESLYAMLGLLPEDADLRDINATLLGEQVAGYYDPRSKRLRIVEGSATNRVADEMIIAHELDHALEDQAIGLDLGRASRSDDAGYAYKALVEGTATKLMTDYVARHFDPETALGGLLATSIGAPSTGNLPPFIVSGLTFPYLQGERFVSNLYARTGSWQLVDVAQRERPPVSTEQVLHPEKWMAAEEPVRVDVPSPGRDWVQLTSGVFGEWQTGELLELSGRAQPAAAAGWGGDRYALYGSGDDRALVIRWVHDSARDGEQFAEALEDYREQALGERVSAVGAGDDGVTLAIAPSVALARRLAGLD